MDNDEDVGTMDGEVELTFFWICGLARLLPAATSGANSANLRIMTLDPVA